MAVTPVQAVLQPGCYGQNLAKALYRCRLSVSVAGGAHGEPPDAHARELCARALPAHQRCANSSNRKGLWTVFESVAGRVYEFPDGSIYQVIVSGTANGGTRSEVDITLPPGALTPPPHIHRQQNETVSVMDGAVQVLGGRQWRTLGSGDSVSIPAGTVHTYRIRSDEITRFVMTHTPAMGFERYLERLYWLTAMNRIRPARTLTSSLYTSLLLEAHRDDLVLAGAAARARVGMMARAAKLLRLRIDR